MSNACEMLSKEKNSNGTRDNCCGNLLDAFNLDHDQFNREHTWNLLKSISIYSLYDLINHYKLISYFFLLLNDKVFEKLIEEELQFIMQYMSPVYNI